MARIFISYSRVDNRFVEALAEKLRRVYGYDNVWFDEGLHGGDIWWEEILEQIADRDIFIYVLSNDSVQSDYCQAEFEEARRLQKQIITVQARDRTKLTDELGDIHYINMINGVDDANALMDLVRSVNKRMSKVPRRTPKPLWEPITPRPNKVDEKPRPDTAPDVDTPTLQPPQAEREKRSSHETIPWWKKPEFIIGMILVPIIATVIGGLIQNPDFFGLGSNNPTPSSTEIVQLVTNTLPSNNGISDDDARSTGAAQAYATLTALAPTNTPTITQTPSNTPISSSDIQVTARAEIFATETSISSTQAVIAQNTQNAVLTEQFIAGSTATYIVQLSLTPPATNTAIPPTPTLTANAVLTEQFIAEATATYNTQLSLTPSPNQIAIAPINILEMTTYFSDDESGFSFAYPNYYDIIEGETGAYHLTNGGQQIIVISPNLSETIASETVTTTLEHLNRVIDRIGYTVGNEMSPTFGVRAINISLERNGIVGFAELVETFEGRYSVVIVVSKDMNSISMEDANIVGMSINPTVLGMINADDNYSIFSQMLAVTGIDELLNDTSRNWTIFTLSNNSIEQYVRDRGISIEQLLEDIQLSENILQSHIINNMFTSDQLTNSLQITSLNGITITIIGDDNISIATRRWFYEIESDVLLTINGVVHEVDDVIE